MAKTFKTANAFRTSLEQRLKDLAASRRVPLNSLRLKVVIERLLARLFRDASPPWLLKGGYAMELRYRPNARTTKDIDLSVPIVPVDVANQTAIDSIRDELQAAADLDLGDFLIFRIGTPQREFRAPPLGGGRFPVEAVLAGKVYARFHIDIGFGDPVIGSPERLQADDMLAFAGIEPALVLAIPKAQQFAEKVHAYTFPWTDRPNTRTRDLIDLLTLIEAGMADAATLRDALRRTFETRGSHALPKSLLAPPETWSHDFDLMATETKLFTHDLLEGFRRFEQFWNENHLG